MNLRTLTDYRSKQSLRQGLRSELWSKDWNSKKEANKEQWDDSRERCNWLLSRAAFHAPHYMDGEHK